MEKSSTTKEIKKAMKREADFLIFLEIEQTYLSNENGTKPEKIAKQDQARFLYQNDFFSLARKFEYDNQMCHVFCKRQNSEYPLATIEQLRSQMDLYEFGDCLETLKTHYSNEVKTADCYLAQQYFKNRLKEVLSRITKHMGKYVVCSMWNLVKIVCM